MKTLLRYVLFSFSKRSVFTFIIVKPKTKIYFSFSNISSIIINFTSQKVENLFSVTVKGPTLNFKHFPTCFCCKSVSCNSVICNCIYKCIYITYIYIHIYIYVYIYIICTYIIYYIYFTLLIFIYIINCHTIYTIYIYIYLYIYIYIYIYIYMLHFFNYLLATF